MGTAGVFFLVVGAVLYWVVEVDLPYVDDDALGAIAIVAGIVALAVSFLVKSPYRSRGVGSGAVGLGVGLIAFGAIVYWAVDLDLPYIFDDALAVVLMIGGVIGVIAAVLTHVRHSRGTR